MKELRLNCTACGAFQPFDRRGSDPKTVVRCDECGKKHSRDSVYMVRPGRSFDRDESGALLEYPY